MFLKEEFTEIEKKFNFTYEELTEECRIKSELLNRDVEDLSRFGITNEYRLEFNTDLINFEEIMWDEEYENKQIFATQERDEAALQLRIALRDLMQSVKLAFGSNSAVFKAFRYHKKPKNHHENGHGDYAHFAIKMARKYIEKLSAYGADEKFIEKLENKRTNYLEKSFLQKLAIHERDLFTQKRRITANALYDKLIQITSTGKRVYYGTNEAKYNDYLFNLREYRIPDDKNPEAESDNDDGSSQNDSEDEPPEQTQDA